METLKGIFSMPKMDRNRRNFLRENKLSLRELQRVTNKNKLQQQQEQELREHKYAGKRAVSQQRNNGLEKLTIGRCPSLTRVPSGRAIAGSVGESFSEVTNHPGRRSIARTNSTTTIKSVHKQVQTEDIQDEQFLYDALKRCTGNDSHSRLNGLQPNYTPRSQPTACDAQIHSYYPSPCADEEQGGFGNTAENLYTVRQNIPQIPNQYEQHFRDPQTDERPEDDNIHAAITNENNADRFYAESSAKYNLAPTPRSGQHHTNGYNMVDSEGLPPITTMQSSYEPHEQRQEQQQLQPQMRHHRMQPHVHDDEVRNNFENVSQIHCVGAGGDCNVACGGDDAIDAISGGVDAVSISGRSRRTNFSHSSQQSNTDLMKKRSTGSVHKLGSRDNLSLPRYLEREKREKEERRLRQSERDPQCPPGHYPLSDSERLAALHSAESRFKALINELNHMPMTTETLRMRVRKVEIEKELKLLETDIRVFSKTKVYVKHKE